MKCKFSALGSVYKGDKAEYLKVALESLQNQTLCASEIILVKDGPVSKQIDEVIASFDDLLPIKVIEIKENVGLGRALKIGLSKCSNEIIARFDSDDINRLNRFELQIKEINSDYAIDLVAGHISEFKIKKNDINSIRKSALNLKQFKRIIVWKNPINHVTVMFKKSCVIKVGGYKNHFFMEDYNLWVRMLSLINIKYIGIDEVLVDVRVGEKSMFKRRRGLQYVKSEYQLFLLKLKYLNKNFIIILFTFFLRLIPRLMPVFILKIIYFKILRK